MLTSSRTQIPSPGIEYSIVHIYSCPQFYASGPAIDTCLGGAIGYKTDPEGNMIASAFYNIVPNNSCTPSIINNIFDHIV
jgi:hypothetical protein